MLIFIGILYIIFLLNTLVPCINFPKMYEGLSNLTAPQVGAALPQKSTKAAQEAKTTLPASTTGTGAAAVTTKEGFTSLVGQLDDAQAYSLGDYAKPNVSSWFKVQGTENIMGRPYQQIPLPEGQLGFFDTTTFSPDACPNSYSSSMGCANITMDQYKYLRSRGGNNVPYSEY